MKLTEHFTYEELTASVTAKNKGIDNTPDAKQTECLQKLCENVLEPLRKAYGKPIKVTSGFRCKKLNKAVGGASTSQHTYGQAADITSLSDTAADNKELFDVALKLVQNSKITVGQLIDEYNYNWVHISTPGSHKNQILHIR